MKSDEFKIKYELLKKAFDNRTRQFNFYRLYCSLLSGEITEEEYNKEIEDNEDKYVIPCPSPKTMDEIMFAFLTSTEIMILDTDSTGETQTLFEIDDESLIKFMKE